MLEPLILAKWTWEPSVIAGLALFLCGYLVAAGPLRSRFQAPPVTRGQAVAFVGALSTILFALASPLDALADGYLFSAHMVQHLLLTLVMPILLLLGLPGWIYGPLLRRPGVLQFGRLLTLPLIAFISFNVIFIVWHLPALYELMLKNLPFHIFTHLLFMATGVLTWWPVLSAVRALPRLSPGLASLYLIFQTLPATALAAYITLSPRVLYPTYAAAPRLFGLAALADQQLAGLVMWLPGTAIYFTVLTVVFLRWFGEAKPAPLPAP